MEAIKRNIDNRIDELEEAMLHSDNLIDCPLVHLFTDRMYIRQIFMPKGTLITSKIHKTQHPYSVTLGSVAVKIDNGEWVEIKAPYTGITQPGTRRVLYILEDTIWTTFHPLDFIKGNENELSENELNLLLEKIEDTILEPHINCITGTNINKDYKKLIDTNKNTLQCHI